MLIFQAIIAAFFGLLLGNYATTFYHRLPLNKPINGLSNKFGLKPHCSHCKHQLEFYEYYPILGWIYTKFSCVHCGKKIDMSYFYIEFSSMLGAAIAWYFIGLNYSFIAALAILVPSILLSSLYIKTKKIYYRILPVIFTAILIFFYNQYV